MLKANVGSSTLPAGRAAGREAAKAAKANLDHIKLAFVYCSCEYDVAEVMAGVAEVLPGVPRLGNTSFTGIITPEGYIGGDTPFVGIMVLSDPTLMVGTASISKGGTVMANGVMSMTDPGHASGAPSSIPSRDTLINGALLAKAAMAAAGKTYAPDCFYMAASPAEEEYYLKGISYVIGRVPFFGGSAADNSIAGQWKLYCGNDTFSDGCVVAFFYGAKIHNLFTGAYHETNDFGVITKIDGKRTLVEIDGVPATEKYMQWTGCSKEAVTGANLLSTTITSPLGVKDRLGDLTAIRHPMNGNPDGSMAIGNNLAEKTCVIRMEATVDELIESVSKVIKTLLGSSKEKPAALHLVHCGGRRAGIGDRIDEVAKAAKEAAGDIPFIMEFTFGEYGYTSDNNNTCGGLMLSFTAFSR
jgi:hypothetical protein